MRYHYVWLVWSIAFLLPWLLLFLAFDQHRRKMWWTSLLMAPFGLTEPLFVPEYWNPPSLFELAQTTGFDVESIIFSFAIGGVGAVLYNIITRKRLEPLQLDEWHLTRDRWHRWALATPFALFPSCTSCPGTSFMPASQPCPQGRLPRSCAAPI